MHPIPACCLLLALAAAIHAGDAVLDLVMIKDKGPRQCWVVSENADDMKWRTSADAPTENKTAKREVKSVEYAFQRQTSAYTQGLEARERGKFEESAELFGQLAGGDREAEIVVGSLEAGASWELAGKFAEAATAFALVIDKAPAHPLAFDARYRLGMAYAMNKATADKADEVAKKLEEDAKGKGGQQANVRASAIRAALGLLKGDDGEVRRQVSRASFNPELERGTWLHFNLFMADALLASNKGKEAVQIYDRMLPALANDPAAAARVHLGIGLSKVENDRLGAIAELLTLDALPYGSPDQKCEARYQAGRLLWAEVQAMPKAAADDERKAAFAKDSIFTARILLQAAANSTSKHPSKAQAAEVLKTMPPDEDEEKGRVKAEADAKLKAEADAKAKVEAEAKAKAKAEADAKAKAKK
jgi:hypothetical protein